MERRRRLSSKEDVRRIRSLSYDNSTFIPDPCMQSMKEEKMLHTDSEHDDGGCGHIEVEDIVDDANNCASNNTVSEVSIRTSIACDHMEEKGNEVGITGTEVIKNLQHDFDDQLLNDTSETVAANTASNEQTNTNTTPTENSMNTKSPNLGRKSFSLDYKLPRPTAGRQERTSCKIRSYSDTYNPLTRYHLNTKTNQFEKKSPRETVERRRKKYKYHSEIPSLSPITGDESVFNEVNKPTDTLHSKNTSRDIVTPVTNCQTTDTDKMKINKRWLRKITKYATFDESNVYLTKRCKSTLDISRDRGEGQADTSNEGDSCAECYSDSIPQRRISTGKLIKQSVSQGFSKFKQLSLGGKSHGRKMEHSYSMISDDDTTLHETSKRVEALKLEERALNTYAYDVEPATSKVKMIEKRMQRCASMPDCRDSSSSEGSTEDLSDLYLPRRMAICPDLPVEAMKQLRTYLVLTRLKQYCIV